MRYGRSSRQREVSCHDRPMTSSTDAFRAARDLLLAHREDYDTARRSFDWPSTRRVQLGARLVRRDRGRAPGPSGAADPVRRRVGHLVDVRVAVGAVVAGGRLAARARGAAGRPGAADARQRGAAVGGHPGHDEARGGDHPGVHAAAAGRPGGPGVPRAGPACHHRCGSACRSSPRCRATGPGSWSTGRADGWHSYSAAFACAGRSSSPEGVTRAGDPLLLYFTSGTTALPKLVAHTQVSYPVGHLSTMYWVGIQPGDVHLNLSSPGWAKHAWSNVYAPWNAGATVLVLNYQRFSAASLLAALGSCGVTTFCAPPTVWRMLIQADLGRRGRFCAARVRGRGRAAEPRGDRAGAQGLGDHGPGRVRPDRDDRAGREHARASRCGPGSMGRPLPGYSVVLVDPVSGQPGRDGEICLDLSQRPLGLMTGYLDDDELNARGHGGRVLPHRRRGHLGRRRLHHLRGPDGRRVQGLGLPDLAVRAGERADRARGGGRGRGGAVTGPGSAGRAEGLRAAGRGARRRRASWRSRSWPSAGSGSRRTSGSGGWSSATCPRRSPARSAGWNCAAQEAEARPSSPRGTTEFWEEDFTW